MEGWTYDGPFDELTGRTASQAATDPLEETVLVKSVG